MPSKMVSLLLDRADMDVAAVEALVSQPLHAVADEPLGQLAQQAVEKFARAVLIAKNLKMGHEHDLSVYFDMLGRIGSPVPADLVGLVDLTPFALRLRYDTLARLDMPPIPRDVLAEKVRAFRDWARGQLP